MRENDRQADIHIYIYIYIYIERERERERDRQTDKNLYIYREYIYPSRVIGISVRVFAYGPGDLGSIPCRHTKNSKNGT